jgi:hypothetical protein
MDQISLDDYIRRVTCTSALLLEWLHMLSKWAILAKVLLGIPSEEVCMWGFDPTIKMVWWKDSSQATTN